MKRGRRLFSLILVGGLMFGLCLQANASSISEAQKKAQELEEQKRAAEAEQTTLSEQLNTIVADMEGLQTQITAMETEIEKAEEELIAAQIDENDQYESMKKRIKYMYENGNSEFLEILLEAKTISEFLNNAEYITKISEYDRKMLVEFQKVVEDVKDKEEELKEENAKLTDMQDQLIAKQESVKTLLAEKSAQIADLDSEIGSNAKALSKLIEDAKTAARKQQEKANSGGGSAGGSVISGNGQFTHPCPGYSRISSPFGDRDQPIAGASTNHKGIDYAAPVGTPIYAADAGTVVSAGYSGNAGNLVVINHGNGLVTKYMHCNKLFVSSGQKVSRGQNIAVVGNTGNSTGPHLHFQVESGGRAVNPAKYL